MSATGSLESERLFCWEHAAGVGAGRRADALLRFMGDVPKAVGARNRTLLALRAKLFGPAWFLRCDCPECGCTCDFAVDCARLSAEALTAPDSPTAEHEILVDGVAIRFRLPDIDDLQAVGTGVPVESVATALLGRCVTCPAIEQLSDTARDAVSRRMEILDPAASLSFEVTCSDCQTAWNAPVDIANVLWSELQVAAERTLIEIDALARVYGWSEAQVLSLSAIKRAAYLQLVEAS